MASQAAVSIETASCARCWKQHARILRPASFSAPRPLAESEERYRRITETITDSSSRGPLGRQRHGHRHGPGCDRGDRVQFQDFARDSGLWLDMDSPRGSRGLGSWAEQVGGARGRVETDGCGPSSIGSCARMAPSLGSFDPSASVPLRDGSLLGYDGLIQDVTERRALAGTTLPGPEAAEHRPPRRPVGARLQQPADRDSRQRRAGDAGPGLGPRGSPEHRGDQRRRPSGRLD